MLEISFTSNPNGKLFNDNFGDIRLRSTAFFPGAECEIFLKNVLMGYAKIEVVRNFPIGRISDALSYLNCGKPAEYQVTLLNRYYGGGKPLPPDTILSHIIFCYTERKIANQSFQLQDWWNAKF